MTVRLDDSRPTYLQVADVLREEIRRGDVAPGTRLPSVRDLSARFDIAAVTVQSALRVLRDEGLIASRSTRGYFVTESRPDDDQAPEHSSEFVMLRQQLDTLTSAMQALGERVSQLEAVVPVEDPQPESP